jgi:hypothetical protein
VKQLEFYTRKLSSAGMVLLFGLYAACSDGSVEPESSSGDNGSDAVEQTDQTDEGDDGSATSGQDGADSSDVVDRTDASDSNDSIDGVDATNGNNATDSSDDNESSDATDGADVVDGATVADASEEPAPLPEEPTFIDSDHDPVDLQITELGSSPATAVSFVAPASALVSVSQELEWWDEGLLIWSTTAPPILDIVDTQLGFALVLATNGVWIASPDGLEESPLTEHFADALPTTVTSAGTSLWFHTENGLDRWSDGSMQSLSFDGLAFDEPDLAWDGESLWLSSGGALYRLAVEGDSATAWPELSDVPVTSVTGDPANGQLWAIADGDIYLRTAAGEWEWYRLPSTVTRISTHPDSPVVWITTSAATWIVSQGQWRLVYSGLVADFAVEPSGYALLAGPAGVARYAVDAPPPPPLQDTTWTNKVAAIAEEKCGLCHGAGQYAHELAEPEQWVDEFDLILFVVKSGAMPLEPYDELSEQEINILEAWQADGFLE